MNKTILILLMAVALIGCNRRMIPTTETYLVDSVVTQIVEVVRFDTLTIPGQRVVVYDTIYQEKAPAGTPKKAVSQKAATKKGVTLLTTMYNDGSFEAECKTDSLLHVIAVKDKEISSFKSKDHKQVITNTVVKVKYRIPWWVYGIAVALVGYRYRHGIISLLTNKLP